MTRSDVRLPLIRPRFRKSSIAAFLLLTPFVAHSTWDYVETRRLRTRVDAIAARGEPTTARVPGMLTGGAAESARYYAAAAALVAGYAADIPAPLAHELMVAERGRTWSEELADQARWLVQRHAEALMFADRAADLPFEGFQGGSTFPYLTGNLHGVFRLCAVRAQILALDGKPDAAVESIYSAVRITRVTNQMPSLSALAFVLQRTHASQASLAKLSGALADIDREDLMKQDFIRSRAQMMDDAQWRDFRMTTWVTRPWGAHRLSRRLDVFSALVAAASGPATERAKAILAVGEWPAAIDLPPEVSRATLENATKRFATYIERIRCARRLAAGEMVDCQP